MIFRFLFNKLASKSNDLSFWEHAEVLRIHLLRVIIVLVVTSIAAFFFKDFLFGNLILGPLDEDFPTYSWLCIAGTWFGYDSFCFEGLTLKLINIDLAGQFRWHMIISFFAGAIVTFPFAAWQLWLFVKPALKPGELKYSKGMVSVVSLLFFTGVAFGYFIILPLTVVFLANYQLSPSIVNQITISSYISTSALLPLSTGLVFELPILVYLLSRIGMLTPNFLKKNRKYAVILILVIAGIITPSTDMFSQILVALPLYVLYEISISVARRAYRNYEEAAA
jgi:sec-independent protein translocase protein TatC